MADTDNIQAEDLISQDDIDQLLKGIEEIGDAEREAAAADDDLNVEDLVTQDEIDKLLGLADSDGEAGDEPDAEEEADLISQDDIDMLLQGMESADDAGDDTAPADEFPLEDLPFEEAPEADEDLDMVSMDDIENLFKSDFNDLTGESGAPEPSEEEPLISQDDIDSLLAGADSDEAPAQDDLSALLGDGPSDSVDEDESLITQEDIDSLLNEAVADEIFAGDTGEGRESASEDVVSQEDIDRLLKGDMEEEEPTAEETPAAAEEEPVILEDSEELDVSGEEKESGKKWYKSFKIWIAASVVLVLALSGTLYFLFSGGGEPDFEVVVPAEQVETEVAAAPEEPGFTFSRGEKMTSTLTGFIVPAPVKLKGVSYIEADISIDFIDVTSDPIQGYEPFFRNLIYDVLKKALVLNEKSLIVEADLKKMIEEALNDALTEGAVEKVDFILFKIG